jgi:hypothetical protein
MVNPSVPTDCHTKEEPSLLTRKAEDEDTGGTLSLPSVYNASTQIRRLERVLEPLTTAIPDASSG